MAAADAKSAPKITTLAELGQHPTLKQHAADYSLVQPFHNASALLLRTNPDRTKTIVVASRHSNRLMAVDLAHNNRVSIECEHEYRPSANDQSIECLVDDPSTDTYIVSDGHYIHRRYRRSENEWIEHFTQLRQSLSLIASGCGGSDASSAAEAAAQHPILKLPVELHRMIIAYAYTKIGTTEYIAGSTPRAIGMMSGKPNVSIEQWAQFSRITSIAVTPDGAACYVADFAKQNIFAVTLRPFVSVTALSVAGAKVLDPKQFVSPSCLAIDPRDGGYRYLWVFGSGDYTRIDLASNQRFTVSNASEADPVRQRATSVRGMLITTKGVMIVVNLFELMVCDKPDQSGSRFMSYCLLPRATTSLMPAPGTNTFDQAVDATSSSDTNFVIDESECWLYLVDGVLGGRLRRIPLRREWCTAKPLPKSNADDR